MVKQRRLGPSQCRQWRKRALAQERLIGFHLCQKSPVNRLDGPGAGSARRGHRLFMQGAVKAGALRGKPFPGRQAFAALRLIERAVHERGRVLHLFRRQHRPIIAHERDFDRPAQLQAGE